MPRPWLVEVEKLSILGSDINLVVVNVPYKRISLKGVALSSYVRARRLNYKQQFTQQGIESNRTTVPAF